MIPSEQSSFHSKIFNDQAFKVQCQGRYAVLMLKVSMDEAAKVYGVIHAFIKMGNDFIIALEAAEDSWIHVPLSNVAYMNIPSIEELKNEPKDTPKDAPPEDVEVKRIESDLADTMERVEKQKEKIESAIKPKSAAATEGQKEDDSDFVF